MRDDNSVLKMYQQETKRTFKKHEMLYPEQAELLDWGLGMAGEVGEVVELLKHHIFHGEKLDRMKMTKELGDVFWYLTAIASSLNIQMDNVMLLNVYKLRHRYEQKYTDKDSTMRHTKEKAFEETNEYKMLCQEINIEDPIKEELIKEELIKEDKFNPNYYRTGLIEPIDFIIDQNLNFNLGNVVKYTSRYSGKNGLEDLKKAAWYLDKEIKVQEKREKKSRKNVNRSNNKGEDIT
jgi:NTP pyrophosphatase (non-canonical NTP hydrolase)